MELEGSEHALSAESLYRHVYSPAGRRAGLPRLLAQRKPKRGRRRRNGRREPAIPNRTPIHQRPTKAHLRSQFSHWEGDLMHFRRQRDILLTLQDRRFRLTLVRRLLGIVAAKGMGKVSDLVAVVRDMEDDRLPHAAHEALLDLVRQIEAADDGIPFGDAAGSPLSNRRKSAAARDDTGRQRDHRGGTAGDGSRSGRLSIGAALRGVAGVDPARKLERRQGAPRRHFETGQPDVAFVPGVGCHRAAAVSENRPGTSEWASHLLARRPFKVAAVALANKMARIAWALLVRGGTYRPPVSAS